MAQRASRGFGLPHRGQAHHAALRAVGHRAPGTRYGRHHSDRGRAWVSRVWALSRRTRMGRHGRGRARQFIVGQWWVPTIPGVAIFVVSLGFNLLATACATSSIRSRNDRRCAAGDRKSARSLTPARMVEAVRGDVSFCYRPERVGIVGDSGSGKSTHVPRRSWSCCRVTRRSSADRMTFDGIDLLGLERGGDASPPREADRLVLQDPKYSLNPVMTVGEADRRDLARHHVAGSRSGRAAADGLDMLEPGPIAIRSGCGGSIAHQLSGGMGQRVR